MILYHRKDTDLWDYIRQPYCCASVWY